MSNKNWDINAFPHKFPSGRFGMNYPRAIKVSNQEYVKARLLSVDQRFSSLSSYVFACLYLVEKQQLERNISISYCKGKKRNCRFTKIEAKSGLEPQSNSPSTLLLVALCIRPALKITSENIIFLKIITSITYKGPVKTSVCVHL